MLLFPLKSNLFLLSSEAFDGMGLLRDLHCSPLRRRKRAGRRRPGIHLFPAWPFPYSRFTIIHADLAGVAIS